MDSTKGFFNSHLRPFTGGQAHVLERTKSNQNNHAVPQRFPYRAQTALGQSGCSGWIFSAPGALKLRCD